MTTRSTRGRGWAYTGAILGGAVSIVANIAHSYVPPTGAPTDWTPQKGAVTGSVVWPVILFFAVEILARVKWPNGQWWAVLRFGGFLPIAFVAGFVSYRHLSALLVFYGEDPLTAVIGPIAIDGLMVMATGALIVTARRYHADSELADAAASDAHAEHTPAITHSHHTPEPAAVPGPAVAAHLLPSARFAANQHAHATGRPITADELATAINIPVHTARALLSAFGEPTHPGPSTEPIPTINGTPVGAR